MNESKLIDAILDTDNDTIDQAGIDAACLQRLKHMCGDYGDDGDIAYQLLGIVKSLLEL